MQREIKKSTVTERADNRRRWITAWMSASRDLKQLRANDIRHADTRRFVRFSSGMLTQWLRSNSAGISSGLIEQQKYFRQAGK
jgi:hypothetical protein